jgi:uncharacterized protein YidB (DUF937 family)
MAISDTESLPRETINLTQESSVDWGAILAGVFVSLAISSVFISFGSAVGLSVASFQTSDAVPVVGLIIAASLWLLWVQISSFLGGAYVTGRMSRRLKGVAPHEVEMRDGMQGLVVWAVNLAIAALIAAWFAMAGVGAALNASGPNGLGDAVDRLVRNEAGTVVISEAAKSEISRIITKAVTMKTVDSGDSAYLVRQISADAGLSETDAQQRLNDTLEKLRLQADRARRYGVLFAFLTAASFLVSAVAAWWAGTTGGRHRDAETDHSRHLNWS